MTPRTDEQNAQIREQRRAELLDAALRVFSDKGFHGANVADVAKAAGVSQGTVYHYFESKEALFLAVFTQWEMAFLHGDVDQELATATRASEKLRLLARATARRLAAHQPFLQAAVEFWSHIPRRPEIRTGFQRLFEGMVTELMTIIRQGIDSGEFRDTDPNRLARLLIATYDGLILQSLADHRAIDWAGCSETLIDIVFKGLLRT